MLVIETFNAIQITVKLGNWLALLRLTLLESGKHFWCC